VTTDPLNAAAALALARLAGIDVPAHDADLLARTLQRYAAVVAPLQSAALEGIEPPATSDPRAGW
jgi:hypothetical protein